MWHPRPIKTVVEAAGEDPLGHLDDAR